MDPRPLTLRQLDWAARGRRREEWDRVAALQSWLSMVMAGEKIAPASLNPFRGKARPAAGGPVSALEDAAAWALLDTCFGK